MCQTSEIAAAEPALAAKRGWDHYESTGWRWTGLGVLLLAIMFAAVYTCRHDPIAISGLFFAIAAILHAVPPIIEARQRLVSSRTSQHDRPPEA